MKVVLLKDVSGLGKRGDAVQVAEGYARNYLIPRGLAEAATDSSLRAAEHLRQEKQKQADRHLREAQRQASQLDGKTVKVRARAGEGGKLFGSITGRDIADAISAQLGVEIDRRRVMLGEPIKTLGLHPVRLHLLAEVDATVRIEVLPE